MKHNCGINFSPIAILIISAIFSLFAAPPPNVPGEKITNEIYYDYITSKNPSADTLNSQDSLQDENKNVNNPQHTWGAIPIHDQIALDTTAVKYGNGALFIPRMSAAGSTEPNFYIYDSENERVATAETGRKINLLPGNYTLKIIENVPFDIVEEFEIRAGEITPMIPSWTGVAIEVIDETGKAIRGEYDLALLDPLMSIGRGRGRDIDLAEDLRIWFLPAGYYKIIGVGSPLNSISNFLTFKITDAGEFMRFTLVQDPETNKILGGGMLLGDLVTNEKNRKWSNSVNLGGSIDFNYYNDAFEDSTANLTNFSLLLFNRFTYNKNKMEVMNLARIDVAFLLEDMKWKTLRTTSDELRINSLFTYRLFQRSGPYWRGEFVSSVFPKSASFEYSEMSKRRKDAEYSHLFLMFDEIPETIDDDTPVKTDKNANSIRISPSFSPIQLQAGGGYNIQILRNRIIDMRFLSGFGVEYEKQWDSWSVISEKSLNFDTGSNIFRNIYDNANIDRITLERNNGERFDYGPEFMLNYFAYFTRYISLDGNIRFFIPIERYKSPDFRSHTLLSFRLTRFLSIDYDYTFDLIQADQEELRVKSNRHRILARFSFARR